jgi:hypothetical protein
VLTDFKSQVPSAAVAPSGGPAEWLRRREKTDGELRKQRTESEVVQGQAAQQQQQQARRRNSSHGLAAPSLSSPSNPKVSQITDSATGPACLPQECCCSLAWPS